MEPAPPTKTTHNAVKLVGEAVLPGASLLMDGKVAHGGAHMIAGVLAKALLGPVGLVLVIANSYASSTTGQNLLKQFKQFKAPSPEDPTSTPASTIIKPT